MEAAKRMFDNSYNQRLETAALAKAYLETSKLKEVVLDERKIKNKVKNGRVCSVIGIFSSMMYCLIIFGMIIMPLIKETELHKVKIEISQHRSEINRLKDGIYEVKLKMDERSIVSIKEVAMTQLNLVDRDNTMSRPVLETEHFSLEAARNAYYDTTVDYMSKETLD